MKKYRSKAYTSLLLEEIIRQNKKSSKNATHTVKLLLKKDQRNASEKVAEAYKSKRPIAIILHT